MPGPVLIAPSILAADFGHLAREIEAGGYSDYQSNGAPFDPAAVLDVKPLLKSI